MLTARFGNDLHQVEHAKTQQIHSTDTDSFSGLAIFDFPFGILSRLLNKFNVDHYYRYQRQYLI